MTSLLPFAFILMSLKSGAVPHPPVFGYRSGVPVRGSLIDQIPARIMGQGPSNESLDRLNDLFKLIVMKRFMDQPALSTSYSLRPWRKKIQNRVDDLAIAFASALEESSPGLPANVRAERLADILATLAAVIANNKGGRDSDAIPLITAGGTAFVSGLGLYLAGNVDAGIILNALGIAADVGAFVAMATQQRSTQEKLALGYRLIDYFWQRVGDIRDGKRSKKFAPTGNDRADVVDDQRSRYVSAQTLEEGCAKLLAVDSTTA